MVPNMQAIQKNMYMFNHMLIKAHVPQASPQGPVPGTSGTDQPPATAGTSQDQGTSCANSSITRLS